MQLNIHFIRRVILTEMANVLEEARFKGDIMSSIGLHGVPLAIDAAVIDGKYLILSNEQADVKNQPISLSHMLSLGVFDANGKLSAKRSSGHASWQVSKEFLQLCHSKPFGNMSDFQALGLWALLDGIYHGVRSKILTYQNSFGKDLEDKVKNDPTEKHVALYRSIKSLSRVTLDIQKYLSEFFQFETSDVFTLMPSEHSSIFMKEGWSHIAQLPRKTVVVFPTDKSILQRYVSAKQWENLLTRSDKALNIINLEPVIEVSMEGDNFRRGFNYFIPGKDGNIFLPPSFGNLKAKSRLLGVVDRIHVYQVTLSNGKILTVNHLPLLHEEDIATLRSDISGFKQALSNATQASKSKISVKLKEAENKLIKLQSEQSSLSTIEQNYLHHADIRLDDSLLIHGGRGSDLLLKLAYSHTDGTLLNMGEVEFQRTFGRAKQTVWPEHFFQLLSLDIEQPKPQTDHTISLYRNVLKLGIAQQRERCSDETNQAALQEIERLKHLLVRVQHHDFPVVAVLELADITEPHELARYLFNHYLANNDEAILSDITWLIEMLKYSELELLEQVKDQTVMVQCHIYTLYLTHQIQNAVIDTNQKKVAFEHISNNLLIVARQLKKQSYVDNLSMKDSLLLYQAVVALRDTVEDYDIILSTRGQSKTTFDTISSIKKNLRAIQWFLKADELSQTEEYKTRYNIVESIYKKCLTGILRLPKTGKGLKESHYWSDELENFTSEEMAFSGLNPSALRPFIDALMRPLKHMPLTEPTERESLINNAKTLLKRGCHTLENMIDEEIANEDFDEDDIDEYHFQPLSQRSSSITWLESDAITKEFLGEKYKHLPNVLAVEKDTVLQNQLSTLQNQSMALVKANQVSRQDTLPPFLDEGQRQIPAANFPALKESSFVKSIKDNAPKVIVLNVSFVQKNHNNQLRDPLLLEWLNITKLAGTMVVLLKDRPLNDREHIELRQYFSKNHVNVIGLLDATSQTLANIKKALTSVIGTDEKAKCLCLDVKRSEDDKLTALLSELCFRQEIITSQANMAAFKEDHLLLLHRLAYHYGFLAPFADFFSGKMSNIPSILPFGVRTDAFEDTLLVAYVSIENFVNNIRLFYQTHYKADVGLSGNEQALIEFKKNISQRFREYIGEDFDPAIFGLRPETTTDMSFRENMLKRFRGACGDNNYPSFHNRLRHATSTYLSECDALTPLQQIRLFKELQTRYLEQDLDNNPDKQIIWTSKVFPKVLAELEQQGLASNAKNEKRLDNISGLAKKHFMLSAIRQHRVLLKREPEIARSNEAFLLKYFKNQFLVLDRELKRWEQLSPEDASTLYYEMKLFITLCKPYIDNVVDVSHANDIKNSYYRLNFFMMLLFSDKSTKSILSHDQILEKLLCGYNSYYEEIDVPSSKKELQQWAERFIARNVIQMADRLALEVMNEIEKSHDNTEVYEKLTASVEQLKKTAITCLKKNLTFNFEGYVRKSKNLLALLDLLKSNEYQYISLLKCYDDELWEDDFKIKACNYIHEILGAKLEGLKRLPIDSDELKDGLRGFKEQLQLFNEHFGPSFFEHKLVAMEADFSNMGYVPIRRIPIELLSLPISSTIDDYLAEQADPTSSIFKAYQAFKVEFRQTNYQQLIMKALSYFPQAKISGETSENKLSIKQFIDLVLSGLRMHYDPKGAAPLRNCSNIAFLLDDIMLMNTLDTALLKQSLPRLNELTIAHRMVCRQFLEQRQNFLNSPEFNSKLGFNWLTSFWDDGQIQLESQKNKLKAFLESEPKNRECVEFRQALLKETAQIMPKLSGEGKALYGQVLDEIVFSRASQSVEQTQVNLV